MAKRKKKTNNAREGSSQRGRPGRRTAEDRTQAVLELLSGKASVEQLSQRYGVQPETIEKWREAALEGMSQAMRQGNATTARERELQKDLNALEKAFTKLAIRNEVAERELGKRGPTRPGR